MKSNLLILASATVLFLACSTGKTNEHTKAVEGIRSAEKMFAEMARDKSIEEAFWFYADSNAVIKRGKDSLIHGKEAIRHFYSASFYKSAKVVWSPDFVDASSNGDMGYTYGKFTWTNTDSAGVTKEQKGLFHTVWKRQADGSWKYVWD
jgi:ketosteroid isomerase-like protein